MRRSLLLVLFCGYSLTSSNVTFAQSITNGLIGYWPFNSNGNDLSGGGRPLTIYGGAAFSAGLFGQALDLHANGSQYAGRPIDDAVFDFGVGDFTAQIWAYFNTVQPVQNLIEKFQSTDGPGWTLVLAGSNPVKEPHFFAIEGQINLTPDSCRACRQEPGSSLSQDARAPRLNLFTTELLFVRDQTRCR